MNAITTFVWREESDSGHGDGISRPKPGAAVRHYSLIIYLKGSRPMLWSCKAESKKSAIKYARARWPDAEVEVA